MEDVYHPCSHLNKFIRLYFVFWVFTTMPGFDPFLFLAGVAVYIKCQYLHAVCFVFLWAVSGNLGSDGDVHPLSLLHIA